MNFTLATVVWAIGWAVFIFVLMLVTREGARAYEQRGWGRVFWARLHWVTVLVMSAIIAALLALNELRL